MSGQSTHARHRRAAGKAFAPRMDEACATATTALTASAVLALCAAIVVGATAPAQAGQARAQFKAALRIDARLVERDLATASAGSTASTASANAASASASIIARSASASNAVRLPRADGSGWCVRVAISATSFRWQCE